MSQKLVAIYARVSSKQPAEASTIESQLAVLRERVAQDGFQLSEELMFIDEGYSGASLVRPGLERLRDLIALQGLDRLYVLSPDRLARKYAYQVLLIDEFQRVGVEVVFLNRELRQTPEDELLLQVQGIVAESPALLRSAVQVMSVPKSWNAVDAGNATPPRQGT